MLKRYISIIDRYIAVELLLTWLAVMLVLMLILLGGTFARLMGSAADGSIPRDAVLPFLMFSGISYLILLMPLSLYLGVLFTFSRLYKDNEMSALSACGIGLKRLYRPLLMVTVPATGLLLYLTLYLMPLISQQQEALKVQIENRSELSGLTAGRFNEFKDANATMFLQSRSDDGKSMKNVFLHQTAEDNQKQERDNIESADLASRYRDANGRHFLLFENGQSYEGEPGRADFRITQYQKKGVYLPDNETVQKATRTEALDVKTLWNSTRADYKAELHWRLSLPIGAFLLAVLALPLSYTTPRKGRYSKLGLAIFIYLIYSNLLGIGQTWVQKEKVPEWLGIWWVHGFAISLILIWWVKRAGGIRQILKQKQIVRQM